MYKLFVALRYLRRNWLNLVGMLAVAIGVVVLICVLSVMKGFDEEFRSRIRATLSDLIVEGWDDRPFADYEALMKKIEALPHVVACAPQFEGLGLVRMGAHSRYCEFHGVDLARESRATDFAAYWRAWRGREAREELISFAARVRPEVMPAEKLKDLLSRMRPDDFSLLDAKLQRAVRSRAQALGLDVQALCAAANSAMPEWGPTGDPRESPAFAGAEMLVIGQDLAGKPVALGIGDKLALISATDIFEGRVIRRCRVVGAFRSGLYDYDMRNIYLPLADVQQLMDKPGHVTSINIRLDSFANAPEVRARLLGILTPEELEQGLALVKPYLKKRDPAAIKRVQEQIRIVRTRAPGWFAEGNPRAIAATIEAEKMLFEAIGTALKMPDGPRSDPRKLAALMEFQKMTMEREQQEIGRRFRISTWEDKRRTFLRAVWLERRIMGFILFFVILIAGFLILSILHTTVLSKTRDIGILKSIGGSVGGIMSIFLLNGLLMGLIGSALGTAAGMLITRNINAIEAFLARLTGFRLFPPDIYYLDRIPVDKHPWPSTLAICVIAVIVSLAASAYPAWKASRMDAVEALRYE